MVGVSCKDIVVEKVVPINVTLNFIRGSHVLIRVEQ